MVYGLIPLLLFAACSEEPQSLSVQLFLARLAADARGAEYAAWDTVEFAESSNAIAYVVAPEPLLTEWNIIACKVADQGGGLKIIAARLNAYASQKMQKFSADPVRLKQPLGLKVGARWVSFTPLLNQVRDRIQLRGLTAEEAEKLQRDIETR